MHARWHGAWKPGESGNPSGRAAGTVYPAEWLKIMSRWSQEALETVLRDKKLPIAQRGAARTLLQIVEADTDRDQRAALEVVADRTTGKPTQEIRVEAVPQIKTPEQLIEELRERHHIEGHAPPALPPPAHNA